MRPRDDKYQRVLFYRLVSRPAVRLLQTLDYWGTAVDHLGVRAPHTELELVAESTVETSPRPEPRDSPIEALQDFDFRSKNFEFLLPSMHVQWAKGDAVERCAAEAVRGAGSVIEMIVAVMEETRKILRYKRGSTEIGVSLDDLLEGGVGVCQDFAHLSIGMLRSVGVPASYVSGYLFAVDETQLAGRQVLSGVGVGGDLGVQRGAPCDPHLNPNPLVPQFKLEPDNDESGLRSRDYAASYNKDEHDSVSVQTHAWITASIPDFGWWAIDPTNCGMTGERHVVVGHGRDYGDVPPVRGAFMGPGSADVDAEVVIGRKDDDTSDDDAYGLTKPHGPPHIVLQPRIVIPRHGQHRHSGVHGQAH